MNNEFCVYEHITPSNKRYIGITKQTPEKRWKNGSGYKLCTAFNRAIQKYGWDNITHNIIASRLTKDEACKLEQYYIALYDTANPLHGYNLTSGGESYTPNDEWRNRASESHLKYYQNNPDAKAKISERQIGKIATESTRIKMSEARKRYIEAHPEAREKCGATFRGKKRSKENCEKLKVANQKKVMCVETGVIFHSIQDAATFANVCRTSVSNYLTGRSKTCGGYHFEYC